MGRTSWVALFVFVVGISTVACDEGDAEEEAPVERQYAMECEIELVPTTDPPTIRVEATGTDFETGAAATWAAACEQLGLDPGCNETFGDQLRGSPTCAMMTVNPTDSIQPADAEPVWNCNMTVEDRRSIQTITHEVNETLPESEADIDSFCEQAIVDACAQAGAEGDCTAGDAATYHANQSSTRSLVH